MLGLSLSKILFTVIVVIVVWQGFKWVGRVQKQRELAAQSRMKTTDGRARPAPPPQSAALDAETEDMVKCRVCGVFVTGHGMTSCGRADCPYPG